MRNSKPSILVIGHVWPEPDSSAAGVRAWDFCEVFNAAGWRVEFLSPARTGEHSERLARRGIPVHSIPANDSRFDVLIREMKPDFVLFDRFLSEEQFGWRVSENSPDSIRVLDTVDLHFLRRAREAALAEGKSLEEIAAGRVEFLGSNQAYALRELAAIYRCDCALILSDFERALLVNEFGVPAGLLRISRFLYKAPQASAPFGTREHFVMIGNFRHAPNADGVRWLRAEVWPRIHKLLPDAEAHIYGAYPDREIMSLSDTAWGFQIKGPAADKFGVLGRYRVNLAPLRFGAGLKGKIADGWWVGTPCASTPIGSEGMPGDLPWGGVIAGSAEELAREAVRLYTDQTLWQAAQLAGYAILRDRFDYGVNAGRLLSDLLELPAEASARGRRNVVGAILSHHAYQSHGR